ncbi:BTAD domain-containing putative transcriptional regulator [Actinoplanes sp. NPDC051494]|uniref:BTAD domain-containing putative transcriptional regulator n=1 Tax=Actinoplanes sp. NPDC051494 TaxID=3363907 RepID=UPI003791BBD7
MEELRLLGPMEIATRRGVVQVGEPRRLAVLAALTVDTGRVVPTATLVDRVWGDDPPRQAVRTLGTYITRIRRVLDDAFDDSPVTVVNQHGGYRLTARPDQVDLFRFRTLTTQARTPDCPADRRVELLRQAVSLHRGDPLTGADGAWVKQTREQLNGEFLIAMAQWAEAELAVGNATAVLPELTRLADAHRLVEPLLVTLVRALVAAGRPTEALERCRLHQKLLVEEYGTDPSPQVLALYEEILRTDHRVASAPDAKHLEAADGAAPGKRSPARPALAMTADIAPYSKFPGTSYRTARRLLTAATAAILLPAAVIHLWPTDPKTSVSVPAATVFSATEEFSGTELTPGQWHAQNSQGPNGSSWSPNNVRVSDGELQIIGKGRSSTGRGNMAGSVCWCLKRGVVRSYGVWQVRAKFDVGTGYAPVVGLYPDAPKGTPGWGFVTAARLDGGDRRTMYPVLETGGGPPVDGTPVSGDFTAWNSFTIEWRADFVTVSVNDAVVFDTRRLPTPAVIPSVPMFLYVQVLAGPDGPVPAPGPETPDQVTMHVDWAKYTG